MNEIEYLAIRLNPDGFNLAWLDWLQRHAPQLAAGLQRNDGAVVSDDTLRWLTSGPGYENQGGEPSLSVYGAEEAGYKDIVAGRHAVYEGPK